MSTRAIRLIFVQPLPPPVSVLTRTNRESHKKHAGGSRLLTECFTAVGFPSCRKNRRDSVFQIRSGGDRFPVYNIFVVLSPKKNFKDVVSGDPGGYEIELWHI